MSFLKQICCVNISQELDDNYSQVTHSSQEVIQEADHTSTDDSSDGLYHIYDNDSYINGSYPKGYFKYMSVEEQITFTVDNKIELDEGTYNCIKDGYCWLCQVLINNKHLENKLHKGLLGLRNSRVLSEYKDCFISKLPLSKEYHCGTCNDVWRTMEEVRKHCQSEDHKIRMGKCLKHQDTQPVRTQLEPEVKHLNILPFYNINTTTNNLLYNRTSLSYKNNEIAINYDDYAEFALNLEVPPDFTGHLDFGDGKKVFLNAIKIDDAQDNSQIELVKTKTNPVIYPSTSSSEESSNYTNAHLTINNSTIDTANLTKSINFNLNVQHSNDYVVINNKIMLRLKNWHCIIGTITPNCYLCREALTSEDIKQHINKKKHVGLMKDRKFRTIADYGLNIIMELQPKGTYHCGICNIAGLNGENIEVHINSNHHLKHYDESMKRLGRPNASKRKIVEKPLKIDSLYYIQSKGVLVDRLMLFSSNKWQACIITEKNELYCQLCEVKMVRQDAPKHWNEKKHVTNMSAALLLDKYRLNCIRKIRSSLFYCTPCGLMLIGDDTTDSHIRSDSHKNNYRECLASAKEVIDKNLKMKKL